MKRYQIYQVDVFTQEKFQGNPAGVVLDAEGLDVNQMQNIAREINCSETAFIFPPESSNHDFRVRYFTPTTEVPVCGHATIAALYVWAHHNNMTDFSRIKIKTEAGILPIEITEKNNDYQIVITQEKIEFGPIIKGIDKERLLSAFDLTPDALHNQCPIQIVSTGHSKVLIGIKSRDKLNQLSPNMNLLVKLSKHIQCNGYFVFTLDSKDTNILTYGRMFAPAIGINEDPVTGNAHGPAGAYLVQHQLMPLKGRMFHFSGVQGEAIKRTGIVDVTVHCNNQKPVQVQIGGYAVIVFQAEITIGN
ncbi:PhzF family isomerase [Oceanobacillus sp. FSL W8-0428]|uniref:PhzF family isomerase n=1 Tax=Oceanobacillus TaxID=182709 RepID=UPI0030FB89BC